MKRALLIFLSAMRRSTRKSARQTSPAPSQTANTRSSPAAQTGTGKRTAADALHSDASYHSDADDHASEDVSAPRKKAKAAARSSAKIRRTDSVQLHSQLFALPQATPDTYPACLPPSRAHDLRYHQPRLLDSRSERASLLSWFDSVSSARAMPWRKPWIDPRHGSDGAADAADLRARLERRAYEVWISEIMLQQTRVAAVIGYWERWMAQWPTIQALAAATPDDVLAAWRGLGYYSRATRIHDAAKLVCADSALDGLLPSAVDELVARVPGVGRYTAGAISAIVFGRAAPMVDGNVLRVLSRQMGVFGDVKADKGVVDLLWAAADSLVKAVAGDTDEDEAQDSANEPLSDRPGRWGQALMELGSTICTPKPNCAACPITSSCRVYGEGLELAVKKGLVSQNLLPNTSKQKPRDIEDACTFCKPFEEFAELEEDEAGTATPKGNRTDARTAATKSVTRKQATLQSFYFTKTTSATEPEESKSTASPTITAAAYETIVNHARKFPLKTTKKPLRAEETLVCAIRRARDGRYLVRRRPPKGLLAGLWEFPSLVVPEGHANTPAARRRDAERFAAAEVADNKKKGKKEKSPLRYVADLGAVPWLFSHLRLTMHVHLFELDDDDDDDDDGAADALGGEGGRWSADVEAESMGTGMRKCWALVRDTV
ncbi:DNA glycosylase [Xylariomycetidae sp. FL0641]|nr:DNA glycosylase [Xylariomycetidae sp. FL0641]